MRVCQLALNAMLLTYAPIVLNVLPGRLCYGNFNEMPSSDRLFGTVLVKVIDTRPRIVLNVDSLRDFNGRMPHRF